MNKKMIILLIIVLTIIGAVIYEDYSEGIIPDSKLRMGNQTSNTLLIMKTNTSIPYIQIDCRGYLNNNRTNLNLSITNGNNSMEIDIVKICEELKEEQDE